MKSRGGLTDLRLDPLVTTWWSWKNKKLGVGHKARSARPTPSFCAQHCFVLIPK